MSTATLISDEELAQRIGIAYILYTENCIRSNSDIKAMDIEDFVKVCQGSIEDVREIKGLKSDDVLG
jgi:hypothetical protein